MGGRAWAWKWPVFPQLDRGVYSEVLLLVPGVSRPAWGRKRDGGPCGDCWGDGRRERGREKNTHDLPHLLWSLAAGGGGECPGKLRGGGDTMPRPSCPWGRRRTGAGCQDGEEGQVMWDIRPIKTQRHSLEHSRPPPRCFRRESRRDGSFYGCSRLLAGAYPGQGRERVHDAVSGTGSKTYAAEGGAREEGDTPLVSGGGDKELVGII
ncbi:hypothetical protein O3P69_000042 [Scylla paramamosain]|uniref:Uncharacterized protein n=1 Tax=Scylla paramamosain TaxID=85552 RepID=A0AAW0UXA0_SCYPA